MLERGTGRICIIGSALSLVGFVGYTAYAPSKWALRGLADCLRNEVDRPPPGKPFSAIPDLRASSPYRPAQSLPSFGRPAKHPLPFLGLKWHRQRPLQSAAWEGLSSHFLCDRAGELNSHHQITRDGDWMGLRYCRAAEAGEVGGKRTSGLAEVNRGSRTVSSLCERPVFTMERARQSSRRAELGQEDGLMQVVDARSL